MKITLTLTECESETLLQLTINHPWRDVRTRVVGLLLLNAKEHPTMIARKLGVSHQSIYNWRHDWEALGVAGIPVGGHQHCRPRCSTRPPPSRAPKR